MNRYRKIFVIILAFICIVSGCSTMDTQKSGENVSTLEGTYHSPFGFSIDIPSHWLIMSQKEIKDNPDLFDSAGEEFEKANKNVNKDLLNKVKSMIVSGKIEFYLNRNTSNLFFNDNITVLKAVERLPQTSSELNQICTMLPKQLSEILGEPITVYECELRTVAGFNSLYIVSDGPIDGTKGIQYQIQKSPNVILVITACAKNETFEIIKKEFEEIISSLKMD